MKFTACCVPFGIQPLQITKYYYWFLKGGDDFYAWVKDVFNLTDPYRFL